MSGWSQTRFTKGANKEYTVQLKTGNSNNAKYTWLVTPSNGTTTNFGIFQGSTETITWDGPVGIYSLAVQVVDGNGCASEVISQEIEIIDPGDLIFASALPGTIVCSDLAGGVEGSNPGHSQSIFQIVYTGETNLVSAEVTIKNPDGVFVDINGVVLSDQQNPQVSVNNIGEDKIIDLEVSDSWENNTTENGQFEIKLVSGLTTGEIEILADNAKDIQRTITILPKPVLDFN